MKHPADGAVASIIIPCWNQLEFTRFCLAALVRHTRPPWELIVIDSGSTDGTGIYLAGVQDVAPVPVTVVSNAQNLGFPTAINQGLKAARGDYLVLLNNDAVVTDGWLNQLIALAEMNSDVTTKHTKDTKGENQRGDRERMRIGLTGPMSNYASPPQLVENVPYANLEEMHAFARRWREEHRGQWFTAGKLSGFCLLMKRAVYEAIGGLDEQFGLGLFDDDDLAERARRAGFELAVAHDLFVHHFGSRTFTGAGIDANKLLSENGRKFAEKWGIGVGNGRAVPLEPWVESSRSQPRMNTDLHGWESARKTDQQETCSSTAPKGFRKPFADPCSISVSSVAQESSTGKATTSLTMIVRDEERNLPTCLASIRNLFDEIVVVDTGSTDRTREIAREFGARVFDFVWVDDFAAARNAALARATGDYAFWLDADDVLDPPQRVKLQELLDGLRPGDEAAYVVRCKCDPGPNGDGGQTVVDHIRLFPVREGVRWTYAVHEQILPSLRRVNIPVRWTDVTVRHTGYTDPALRERKLQRDCKILESELAERPDDPFVLFNLGSIAVERQDWPTALGHLQRSLRGSAPTDSIVRKLYALIALPTDARRPASGIERVFRGPTARPRRRRDLFPQGGPAPQGRPAGRG